MSYAKDAHESLPAKVLKVATLGAVIAFFEGQYKQARQDAEDAFRASNVKKIGILLPETGEEVGEITVVQPSPVLEGIDENAFLAHVERFNKSEVEEYLVPDAFLDQELIEYCRTHRPDLMGRRIRAVWRDECKQQALKHDGHVIDEATTEATRIATVKHRRPDGKFALAADKYGRRADRLMTELLSGRLGRIVEMPSLESPETAVAVEDTPVTPPVGGFEGYAERGGYADEGGYGSGGYAGGAP